MLRMGVRRAAFTCRSKTFGAGAGSDHHPSSSDSVTGTACGGPVPGAERPLCVAEGAHIEACRRPRVPGNATVAFRSGTTAGPAELSPQSVLPAGPPVAALQLEVNLPGKRVFEQPGAIGLSLRSEQLDRLVHPRVGRITSGPEVIQGTEHVVVPACRKGELQPGLVNDFAGAFATEQPAFEELRFAAPPCPLGLR